MKKIRTLSQRSPIVFSVAVCVLTFLCMRGVAWLSQFFPGTDRNLILLEYEIVGILWPVALALLFGYGFMFRMKGFRSTLVAGLPSLAARTLLLLITIVSAVSAGAQWRTLPTMLVGVVAMIGVGVREEVIFRGVIGNALALKYAKNSKGLWFTAIVAAALFSAIHLQNLLVGVGLTAMVTQLIGAFGMGLVLVVVYLRGGNIWVPILIHAIVDASGLFDSSFVVTTKTVVDDISKLSLGGTLIMLVIHIALCIFLLRKSKQPAIFARLEALRKELQL